MDERINYHYKDNNIHILQPKGNCRAEEKENTKKDSNIKQKK